MNPMTTLAGACSLLSIKPASTSFNGCAKADKRGTKVLIPRHRDRLRLSATLYGSGDGKLQLSQTRQYGRTAIMPTLAG